MLTFIKSTNWRFRLTFIAGLILAVSLSTTFITVYGQSSSYWQAGSAIDKYIGHKAARTIAAYDPRSHTAEENRIWAWTSSFTLNFTQTYTVLLWYTWLFILFMLYSSYSRALLGRFSQKRYAILGGIPVIIWVGYLGMSSMVLVLGDKYLEVSADEKTALMIQGGIIQLVGVLVLILLFIASLLKSGGKAEVDVKESADINVKESAGKFQSKILAIYSELLIKLKSVDWFELGSRIWSHAKFLFLAIATLIWDVLNLMFELLLGVSIKLKEVVNAKRKSRLERENSKELK